MFLYQVAIIVSVVGGSSAWVSPLVHRSRLSINPKKSPANNEKFPSSCINDRYFSPTSLNMAMDYNDPIVGEELAKIQPMTFEEVEEELALSGVSAPGTMNEMDVKLMLVELRLMKEGKIGPQAAKNKQKPTSFSSKFEEALYTKPVFEEYYNELKAKGDHNSMNVIAEYINDPENSKKRYGRDYKSVIAAVEEALNAAPPVNSPSLAFSGFPANMGEAGCKMTLEALGPILDFSCAESDDFPILVGKVTFEDIETAKAAVEQYNGMDMGMGTTLEVVPA